MKRITLLVFLLAPVLLLIASCATSNKPPLSITSNQNISKPSNSIPFASKEMAQYHVKVRERVEEAWRIPKEIFSEKGLSTMVSIRIDKEGNVIRINIDKKSGREAYDESVIRAIRDAQPLPRIPEELKTDTVDLGFNFRPAK